MAEAKLGDDVIYTRRSTFSLHLLDISYVLLRDEYMQYMSRVHTSIRKARSRNHELNSTYCNARRRPMGILIRLLNAKGP